MGEEKKKAIADGVKDLEIRRLQSRVDALTEENRQITEAFCSLRETMSDALVASRCDGAGKRREADEIRKMLEKEKRYSDKWHRENVWLRRRMGSIQRTGFWIALALLALTALGVGAVEQDKLTFLVPLSLGLGSLAVSLMAIMAGGDTDA